MHTLKVAQHALSFAATLNPGRHGAVAKTMVAALLFAKALFMRFGGIVMHQHISKFSSAAAAAAAAFISLYILPSALWLRFVSSLRYAFLARTLQL